MIIPKQLLDKWKALRSEDDANKITTKAIESGFSTTPETVRAAFRNGKTKDEVFKAMAEFYTEKANMIKEYI